MRAIEAWEQEAAAPNPAAKTEDVPHFKHGEPGETDPTALKFRIMNHDFTAKTTDQIIQQVPGRSGTFSYTTQLGQFVDVGGFPLDVKHFFKYAEFGHNWGQALGPASADLGEQLTALATDYEEHYQAFDSRPAAATSAFSPEDPLSNSLGAMFAEHVRGKDDMAAELKGFLAEAAVLFSTNELAGGEYLSRLDVMKLKATAEFYYGTDDLRDFRAGSELYSIDVQAKRSAAAKENLANSWTYRLPGTSTFVQSIYPYLKGDVPHSQKPQVDQ